MMVQVVSVVGERCERMHRYSRRAPHRYSLPTVWRSLRAASKRLPLTWLKRPSSQRDGLFLPAVPRGRAPGAGVIPVLVPPS
jgi:hypothetical protein